MRVKIAILGTSGCGKTYASNILSAEGTSPDNKPPYRPTHSVRIVEFTCPAVSLPSSKYNVDVDVQLWEVGGNPGLKGIWPGVQYNLDGVIIAYDVGKEQSVRDASGLYMSWVTHASTGMNPNQSMILGNKFRGSAEHGPQRIVGLPPRIHHVALNIEDDPNRLKEEVRSLVGRVAQIAMEQENRQAIPRTRPAQSDPVVLCPIEEPAKESEMKKNPSNTSIPLPPRPKTRSRAIIRHSDI